MSRRFEAPSVGECNAVMKEFEARAADMSEEIVRLRKEEQDRVAKLPEIREVYAIKQHCATGMLAHFTLQHEKPDSKEDYMILYQPNTKE